MAVCINCDYNNVVVKEEESGEDWARRLLYCPNCHSEWWANLPAVYIEDDEDDTDSD